MDSTDNVYIRTHDFKLLTYIFLSFLSERIVSGERDKNHIDFFTHKLQISQYVPSVRGNAT